MTTQKGRMFLPDLYNGHAGTHLTAYLPAGDVPLSAMKNDLKRIIRNAERLLCKEKSNDYTDRFLLPLKKILDYPEQLKSEKGSGWVILRTANTFRIMRVPHTLPRLCVVSRSFHIKPLLKWAQAENHCYVLAFDKHEANLFDSSLTGITRINSMPIIRVENENRKDYSVSAEMLRWIDEWVYDSLADTNRPLVLAGPASVVQRFASISKYPVVLEQTMTGSFTEGRTAQLGKALSDTLKNIAEKQIRKRIKQLRRAESKGLVEYSISAIAKQAVANKIQRLYIAEDSYLWGELNQKDGTLKIHIRQKNIYDDDILDDLAEIVLRNQAEVILLPSSKIPQNQHAAAILKKGAMDNHEKSAQLDDYLEPNFEIVAV